MTYNVLMGTLNPTHSLTLSPLTCPQHGYGNGQNTALFTTAVRSHRTCHLPDEAYDEIG